MQSKWFGREPAVWIQGLTALLTIAVVFGFPGLNDAVVAAITAVFTAAAAAWTALHVTPVAPTLWGGLVGTVFTLLASFGLHATQQQTGAVTLGAVALMVILTRPQQDPIGVQPARTPATTTGQPAEQ